MSLVCSSFSYYEGTGEKEGREAKKGREGGKGESSLRDARASCPVSPLNSTHRVKKCFK